MQATISKIEHNPIKHVEGRGKHDHRTWNTFKSDGDVEEWLQLAVLVASERPRRRRGRSP